MSKAAIAEKEKFVDAFAEELKAAKAILVINYLGLTVEEVTNMRKELRDNDVKMKVIKNTYLRRAAAKAGIEGLDDTFVGPTAVIYTDNADDVTEPARIVSETLLNLHVSFLSTKMTLTLSKLRVVCLKVS